VRPRRGGSAGQGHQPWSEKTSPRREDLVSTEAGRQRRKFLTRLLCPEAAGPHRSTSLDVLKGGGERTDNLLKTPADQLWPKPQTKTTPILGKSTAWFGTPGGTRVPAPHVYPSFPDGGIWADENPRKNKGGKKGYQQIGGEIQGETPDGGGKWGKKETIRPQAQAAKRQ